VPAFKDTWDGSIISAATIEVQLPCSKSPALPNHAMVRTISAWPILPIVNLQELEQLKSLTLAPDAGLQQKIRTRKSRRATNSIPATGAAIAAASLILGIGDRHKQALLNIAFVARSLSYGGARRPSCRSKQPNGHCAQ
jgi:hypothetical protein